VRLHYVAKWRKTKIASFHSNAVGYCCIARLQPVAGLIMVALCNRADHYIFILFLMVALCNRADHYIFILFLSSFFFFLLLLMVALCNRADHNIFMLFMVALCNRADHYIFALWFLSSFFSSPNLSGRRLDVCHTSTHGVAWVRI